jgi:hypothetical protein
MDSEYKPEPEPEPEPEMKSLSEIPGIILIISCNKHKETRLKEFTLINQEYNGWKVFIIIGNPELNTLYEINNNMITIKCEDSYVHVMKKVVLSMKILFSMYKIQYGILRCGDDLVFNEDVLHRFTQSITSTNNPNYLGKIANPMCITKYSKKIDYFIPHYFYTHQEDITNPYNGLQNMSLNTLLRLDEVPNIPYTGGVIFYVSLKSCNILICEMESVNWNIFNYNNNYGFTYIIEDIGIGYTLYKNNIFPQHCDLYSDIPNKTSIAYHTNKYK